MADSTQAAFFYGTLMAPEVFFTVCYRGIPKENVAVLRGLHDFKPAILHGFCRRRVKGVDYPGIIPDKDHEVRGMYVTGLTPANMYHLDKFEGSEYERRRVKACLLSKTGDDKGQGNVEGDKVECEVYVFNHPDNLEGREWDFEEFRREKMKKWTREDYGFDDTDHFTPQAVDEDEKQAAVCKSICPQQLLSCMIFLARVPYLIRDRKEMSTATRAMPMWRYLRIIFYAIYGNYPIEMQRYEYCLLALDLQLVTNDAYITVSSN